MAGRVGCIILAAGQGKRMKSKKPKVLHELLGIPMAGWVLNAVKECGIENPVMVVGHEKEMVMAKFQGQCAFASQDEQLGTGHAVMQAMKYLEELSDGYVVVVSGDTPLITAQTIQNTINACKEEGCAATVLSAIADNAFGYGRIVRAPAGDVLKIVEQKDASPEEQKIMEVNAGIYCFYVPALIEALHALTCENSQGEYYLTDTIAYLRAKQQRVGCVIAPDMNEIIGINDRVQLSKVQEVKAEKIAHWHMENGVTIHNPKSVYIAPDAVIGMDTQVLSGTNIGPGCIIGEGCVIGPNTVLENTCIGDRTKVNASQCYHCIIGDDTTIGPFAHLRPATHLGNHIRIGNFVELKNAKIDDDTKVSHLTYLGDSVIGKRVNFGCGVITVNYNGDKKYITTVHDDVFVGCNSNLVAPITINSNSYIACGSTVTDEVMEGELAVARAKQVNKPGWVKKWEEKKK